MDVTSAHLGRRERPGVGTTINRYSYVQNNPINFTDPSGFETVIFPPDSLIGSPPAGGRGGDCVGSCTLQGGQINGPPDGNSGTDTDTVSGSREGTRGQEVGAPQGVLASPAGPDPGLAGRFGSGESVASPTLQNPGTVPVLQGAGESTSPGVQNVHPSSSGFNVGDALNKAADAAFYAQFGLPVLSGAAYSLNAVRNGYNLTDGSLPSEDRAIAGAFLALDLAPIAGARALNGAATGGRVVLWSGPGTREAAEAFAKQNGAKTLGQTAEGRILGFGGRVAAAVNSARLSGFVIGRIDAASARFARSAQGTVHVFIAGELDATSTFIRKELPELARELSIVVHR